MREEVIGKATLIHADCREAFQTFNRKKHYRIITDPVWPNSPKLIEGWDRPYQLFEEIAPHLGRLAKSLVIHVGCASDPRILKYVPENLRYLRTCWLPWETPHVFGRDGRRLSTAEVAHVFGEPVRSAPGRKMIPAECTPAPAGLRSNEHPCCRNLHFVKWLVNWFSDPDDPVLDPFLGSGTTGVAAVLQGRTFYGMEIDQKHFDLSCRRLEKAQKMRESMEPYIADAMATVNNAIAI